MNEEQIKLLAESLGLDTAQVALLGTMIAEAFEKAKDEAKEDGKKEGKEEGKKESEDEKEELKESYEAQIAALHEHANAYGTMIAESVEETASELASIAVDEFIAENTERFTKTEQFERMQGVLNQLKESFEANGFSINENANLDAANAALKESQDAYEGVVSKLNEATETLAKTERTLLFERATSDLSVNQREKAQELLESLTFTNSEEFEKGLTMIVESASSVAPITPDAAATDPVEQLNESKSPLIGAAADYLARNPGFAPRR